MDEVKYEYTARGEKVGNLDPGRSPSKIPGECGSLPVRKGIVNGQAAKTGSCRVRMCRRNSTRIGFTIYPPGV